MSISMPGQSRTAADRERSFRTAMILIGVMMFLVAVSIVTIIVKN